MYKGKPKASQFDLSQDVENIKAALADASRDLKGRAGEMLFESLKNAKNKSEKAHDEMSNYVAERPIKALGIAALAGIALGFLISKL